MGDEETRRIILARRAKFVAAALVSVNAVMCGGESAPQPCLTPNVDGGAEDGSIPQPCLSPQPPDASADAADAAIPQPCLAPQPPDGGDADGGDGG